MGRQYGSASAAAGGSSQAAPAGNMGGESVGRPVKFCQACGAKIDREAVICPACGVPCKGRGVMAGAGMAGAGADGGSDGIVVMVLGIVSVVSLFFVLFYGIIPAAIALTCGIIGRRIAKRMKNGLQDGESKAGGIMCQIGEIGSVVYLSIAVIYCIVYIVFDFYTMKTTDKFLEDLYDHMSGYESSYESDTEDSGNIGWSVGNFLENLEKSIW